MNMKDLMNDFEQKKEAFYKEFLAEEEKKLQKIREASDQKNEQEGVKGLEKDRIKKSINNAIASMRLEGFEVTSDERNLIEKRLMGEITEEQFFNTVLERIEANE